MLIGEFLTADFYKRFLLYTFPTDLMLNMLKKLSVLLKCVSKPTAKIDDSSSNHNAPSMQIGFLDVNLHLDHFKLDGKINLAEIGRASCRERV